MTPTPSSSRCSLRSPPAASRPSTRSARPWGFARPTSGMQFRRLVVADHLEDPTRQRQPYDVIKAARAAVGFLEC